MSALMTWLDEMDTLLVGPTSVAETEHRLETLIDQGMVLLADAAPAGQHGDVDPQLLDRVHHRLRAIADEVASELDAVRRERRELARTGRAHAGYHAAALSA